MSGLSTGLAPEWLELREGADAAARAGELVGALSAWLAQRPGGPLVIRDLGCGTGSMGRWLAGRLPGQQQWVLRDRDPELLARAAGTAPGPASDGQPVTVRPELADLTEMRAADLGATSLVTASALLDLLTVAEVVRLATACLRAGCPALLTLSVLGRVQFDPADPLDAELETAFNNHQRREIDGRRLLGPDAFDVAAQAFDRGAVVLREESPWRLGPGDAALIEEWLRGWVFAAVEQRPGLAETARAYLRNRLDANAAGELRVVVAHGDLLALPEGQL